MTSEYFLGFNFKPIEISFQSLYQSYLAKYPVEISSYSFAALSCWDPVYSYKCFCLSDDTLLLSCINDPIVNSENGKRNLLQPIGKLTKELQHQLLKEISNLSYPLKIFGVSEKFIEMYPEFCSHFEDQNERDMAGYLYKTEDLAHLNGRHYERKRNLIYQAENQYPWEVENLTLESFQLCLQEPNVHWTHNFEDEKSLADEQIALNTALKQFKALNLKGIMLRVDRHPAAFSIYNKLNDNTSTVLFEKAKKGYKGLYQIINHETAKAILNEGFTWINREEDLGLEGLRQAKLSYHPHELVPYHILTFKK